MRPLKWTLGIIVALACVLLALIAGAGHGHIDELLVVTVRIVDRESGRPLDGAVVATVRYRSMLERPYLAESLQDALDESAREDAWKFLRIAAARTTTDEITTIRSNAYVTRYWWGPIQTGKTMFGPEVLLVDHPRLGRTLVPIDPHALTPGPEPRTWRLDLGTVRIPPE